MNKSAGLVLAAALLAACSTTPPAPPPTPVVAVVKPKQEFPPRPLTLLYTTFQDHAVIQRDKAIPVWGLTAPGAEVEVSFGSNTAHATADAAGNWHAQLPAMPAGGPFTLAAKSSSGQTQTVTDIMLGDVYLCSGQSNMEFPLRLATQYDSEVLSATPGPIRLFHVQRFTAPVPQKTFGADASWVMTTPANVKEFSAVCYYFGREIQPAAGVPIGLIEDAWGGAAIQAWISSEKLASLGGYNDELAILKTYSQSPQKGNAQWLALVEQWFLAHDPAMKASPAWYDPALDDSSWNSDVATGGWRAWPRLAKWNGTVWMRKTVELTAAQAAGAATLTLGTIEGDDLAFVNGTPVGAGDGYDVIRAYAVPAGVLHEGKNTITVAQQMGGGFLDPAAKMNLKFASGSVQVLTGPWKWKTSVPFKKTGRIPHVPWLNQFGTSTLYNGMIVPLGDTQVRGVVWYQGETDAYQPAEYARLMPAMIEDWRSKFGAGTPFFLTQLPSFGARVSKPQDSDWAALRDVQRRVADTVPNTAMAVTIDLGLPDNIHPAMKQEVGRRLGLLAEKMVYGKDILAASPAPASAVRKGRKVVVTFQNTGTGLGLHEWDRAIGFELCDAQQCRYAPGTVSGNSVVLDAGPGATRVRFCWSDSPICNLVNSAGLPATPFEMAISGANRIRTAHHRDFKHAVRHP